MYPEAIVWETKKKEEEEEEEEEITISRPLSSWIIDQNVQNIVLINNSGTACPTKILMSFWVSYSTIYSRFWQITFEIAHI